MTLTCVFSHTIFIRFIKRDFIPHSQLCSQASRGQWSSFPFSIVWPWQWPWGTLWGTGNQQVQNSVCRREEHTQNCREFHARFLFCFFIVFSPYSTENYSVLWKWITFLRSRVKSPFLPCLLYQPSKLMNPYFSFPSRRDARIPVEWTF